MTIQQFIEKAIEGGVDRYDFPEMDLEHPCITETAPWLLSPRVWKAVGKVEGWDKNWCFGWFVNKPHGGEWKWVESGDLSVHWGGMPNETPNIVTFREGWKHRMHGMIDALAKGKSIEEYLATII